MFMDFSDWKIIPNEFSGSDRKLTLMNDEKKYLAKFPDPSREKHSSLSYINNAFSEYIGCHVFESVGIPVQETLLGTYRIHEIEKVICVCRDFTDEKHRLIEYNNIAISNILNDNAVTTEISDIMKSLEETLPSESCSKIRKSFWDMFIIDALIGNTDRHNKNWGVLYDKKKDEYCFAPIYDCGSSIFPTLSDEGITELFESETVFRNSVLNVYSCLRENGKRINYYQYFKACSCRDFIDALKRVVPKININEIGDIIIQIPYLSNARKDFYFKFLQYRYWEIIIPAYKKVLKNVL